jgi:hypothetical protein
VVTCGWRHFIIHSQEREVNQHFIPGWEKWKIPLLRLFPILSVVALAAGLEFQHGSPPAAPSRPIGTIQAWIKRRSTKPTLWPTGAPQNQRGATVHSSELILTFEFITPAHKTEKYEANTAVNAKYR